MFIIGMKFYFLVFKGLYVKFVSDWPEFVVDKISNLKAH